MLALELLLERHRWNWGGPKLNEAQILACANGVNYWSKKYTLQTNKEIALLAASNETGVDGNA